jgi:parallel beta-helix repeat protein
LINKIEILQGGRTMVTKFKKNGRATNQKKGVVIGILVLYLVTLFLPMMNITTAHTSLRIDEHSMTLFPEDSSLQENRVIYTQKENQEDEEPPLPLDGDPQVQNINTSEYFNTIQAAIYDSHTDASDVIEVNSSVFPENVIVNKSLTIRGINTGTGLPVVDGGSGFGFRVVVNNVTIENMNISDTEIGILSNHSGLTIQNNTFWFDNHSIEFNYTSSFVADTTYTMFDNSIIANHFLINTTDDFDGAIIINMALDHQDHSGAVTIGDLTITQNSFMLNDSHAYAMLYNNNYIKNLEGGSISIGTFNFSNNAIYKENSGNSGIYLSGLLSHLKNDSITVGDIIVSHNVVVNHTNTAFFIEQYKAENWSGTTSGLFGNIDISNNTITSQDPNSDGIYIHEIYGLNFTNNASLIVSACSITDNNVNLSGSYAIIYFMDYIANNLQNNASVYVGNNTVISNDLSADNGILVEYYQCGVSLYNHSNCNLGRFQLTDNIITSTTDYGVQLQQLSNLGCFLYDNASFSIECVQLDDNQIESTSHGIYIYQMLLGGNLSDDATCFIGPITLNENSIVSGGDGILFIDNTTAFDLGNSMNDDSIITLQNVELSNNTINSSGNGIFIGPCVFGGENGNLAVTSFMIADNIISQGSAGLKTKNLSISNWREPVIKNNIIFSCDVGIWFTSSYGNLIYNNHFNNTLNAKDDRENTWNITKTIGINIIGGPSLGGNYWSDYTGIDGDNDTIGDTWLPYTAGGNISSGGDLFPLTNLTGNLTLNAPTGFIATVVSINQINLSWSMGIHATHTRIMQKTGGYPPSISDGSFVYNGTGTACINSSLSAGTRYYFRAWSWNDTNNMWSSTYASASKTTWSVPLAPTSFDATTVSPTEMALTWVKGVNATHTRIQRATANYPINVSDGTNVYNGTSTLFSDSDLNDGVKYYYRAWSWNATSRLWSSTNTSVNATTWDIPHAPSDFSATTVGVDQITLTWIMGSYADNTRIQRKTEAYPANILDGVNIYNSSGSSYTDSSLNEGTLYYYRAWGWNATNHIWSTTNADVSNNTLRRPLAPTSFSASTIGNCSINLSWIKGVNATRTRVMQKTSGYPINISDGSLVYNGTDINCSNSSLSKGTIYYFRAWSWNVSTKLWSTMNASAFNVTAPFAPTGFTATAISSSQINLAWVKGGYANYTRIQRKTGSYPLNVSDGITVYNDTGSSYSDSSLSASTTYYYRAWSWNSSDEIWSANFASAQATTQGSNGGDLPPPPPPSENQAPTAEANGPYTGTVNQTIMLSAAGSSDDVGIVGYRWDWTNDGTWDTTWITTVTTTHMYAKAGSYTVRLQVQDFAGLNDTDTATVTITKTIVQYNQAPVADASGPYNGLTYQNIRFDGTHSYGINASIENYTWVFGDGSTGYGLSPTHAYNSAGTFTVILTVKDSKNLQAIDTTTATITLDANRNNISDIMDQTIGADITQSDLRSITINGTLYYLVDTNDDGIYDVFYSPTANMKTNLGKQDDTQLIDVNGDGQWEYVYDPALGTTTPYVKISSLLDSPLFIITIIAIVLVVIGLFTWLYKTGRL